MTIAKFQPWKRKIQTWNITLRNTWSWVFTNFFDSPWFVRIPDWNILRSGFHGTAPEKKWRNPRIFWPSHVSRRKVSFKQPFRLIDWLNTNQSAGKSINQSFIQRATAQRNGLAETNKQATPAISCSDCSRWCQLFFLCLLFIRICELLVGT